MRAEQEDALLGRFVGRAADLAAFADLFERGARLITPGSPVSRAELVGAAWPGEKLVPSSAKNRLNFALSTLRSLGLRDVLVASDDGYFIDAGVSVRLIG